MPCLSVSVFNRYIHTYIICTYYLCMCRPPEGEKKEWQRIARAEPKSVALEIMMVP
jgi:hypothetical protein